MIHPSLRRKKPIVRATRPRRVRKGSKASQKREADKLFSLYVRARDKRCVICGSVKNLQCAHGFSRRYLGTRFDPENAWAFCASCHFRLTFRPLEMDEWMRHRLGAQYAWVRGRALMLGTKPDYSAILLWLKLAMEKL